MAQGQALSLRLAAARDDREETFPLPPGWDVTVYPPRDRRALTEDEVEAALAQPCGMGPITEAARGASSAAILVDDFRRPTPAERLCLEVIDGLERAGLGKDQITVVLGNGAHRPMNTAEVERRLGAAIARVGRVVSHDAYSGDVTYVGLTSAGTPVLVNSAAIADFSVSISTNYPHRLVSWAGGAKMVLPGICHVSTIHYHHGRLAAGEWAASPASSVSRRDIDEAGKLYGLSMSLCCVVNSRQELCGLCAGEPTAAHRKAVSLARKVGETPMPPGPYDLAIVNSYPLDGDATQYSKAQAPALQFHCPMLIINDFADPSTYHGLYDGPLAAYRRRPPVPLAEHTEELLMAAGVFMYCPQYGDGFTPPDRKWYCESDWGRLMDAMSRRFSRARVAVFPVAPLQIPKVG